MKSRRRRWWRVGAVLAVLIGVPGWLLYASIQHERDNFALIAAIKRDDTATALALLGRGADPNMTDRGEASPSAWNHLRAWWNRLRGKKEETEETYHTPALLLAMGRDAHVYHFQNSFSGNVRIVKALLAKGANCNVRNEHGQTPLMIATGFGEIEIMRLMLDRGANVNAQNSSGVTALSYLPTYLPENLPTAKEALKLLLARGADVHSANQDGWTPLHSVCLDRDSTELIKMLLAKGADVNARDLEGWTPLFLAAVNSDAAAIRCLLDHGAKINAKKQDGTTALMGAAEKGNTETARVLLERGADVNIKDKTGHTALQNALNPDNARVSAGVVKLLKKAGAK